MRKACTQPTGSELSLVCSHKFFNTNNLWVNLRKLKATLDASGREGTRTSMGLADIGGSSTLLPLSRLLLVLAALRST